MKTLKSSFASEIDATVSLKIGDFHFIENMIIAEFKEGSHVTFNKFNEVLELKNETHNGMPQVFISNRIYSYSVDLMDILSNSKNLKFLSAYVIVSYNHLTNKVIELEDAYFSFPRKKFQTLEEAVTWVRSEKTT